MVLAETWFPNDGGKKKKVCVFMAFACVYVCIIVSGEDIFGNFGGILRLFWASRSCEH